MKKSPSSRVRTLAGFRSKNRTATWLGIGVTAFLLLSAMNVIPFVRPVIRKLELASIDWRFDVRGTMAPGNEIVIVAIDEKSVAEVGHWPWPRTKLAELVDKLAAAKSKVIAFDVLFPEAEEPPEGLTVLRQAIESKTESDLTAKEREKLAGLVDRVVAGTSGDQRFADAIRKAGNVVLACYGGWQGARDVRLATHRDVLERAEYGFLAGGDLVKENMGNFPPAGWDYILSPIATLAESTAGLGLINYVSSADRWRPRYEDYADHDGVIRRIPLGMRFENDSTRLYMPLFAQVLRVYWGLSPTDCKIAWGETLRLGDHVTIDMSTWGDMFINWPYLNAPGHTVAGFPLVSVADVLTGKTGEAQLKDKIVLIAATASGLGDIRVTPFDPSAPGIDAHASALDTVLQKRFLLQPKAVEGMVFLFAALMGIAFAFLLPRASAGVSVTITFVATGAWLVVAQLLFRRGLLVPVVLPSLMLFAVPVVTMAHKFVTEQAEKLRIRDTFARYVSPKVVNKILADPEGLKLGGKRGEVTILFSDIRNFTTMSEKMDPEDVVSLLNEYLSAMTETVDRHEGTVDKFIGDAVMAVFGAPIAHPDDPLRAVRTAMAMLSELKRLRAKWESEGRPVFNIGIGINTGPVVVGNIGSPRKMEYTEIGDNVNLASRLESMNKEFGTTAIISHATYERVKDHVDVRRLGDVKVKGKETVVEIYELLGLREGAAAVA